MDPRRINDLLRLVGPLLSLLNELTPMLPDGRAKHFLSGLCFALAFLGTRGAGMEYKSVTEAQVVARLSTQPPPMPPSQDPPTK
jgi:hypothetical protein